MDDKWEIYRDDQGHWRCRRHVPIRHIDAATTESNAVQNGLKKVEMIEETLVHEHTPESDRDKAIDCPAKEKIGLIIALRHLTEEHVNKQVR
ncbi:MAG: hypothetical protein K9N35_12335 [Candidatus Marinimicrobia bacterium]|nr:hypothetical protein [Candidatus Neomarinimicrobiota bacterium]